MDKKNNEQWMQDVAMRYTQEDGKRLRQEMSELEQNDTIINTENLDKKMKRKLKFRNYWKYTAGLGGVAAACLVIALTFVWINSDLSLNKDSDSMTDESIVREECSSESGEDAEFPRAASLELPDHFTVEEKIEEAGKTTYYLNKDTGETVTVIIEAVRLSPEYTTLPVITIHNQTVYGGETEQVLAFEKEGYAYIMTCEQNFEVLMELATIIL